MNNLIETKKTLAFVRQQVEKAASELEGARVRFEIALVALEIAETQLEAVQKVSKQIVNGEYDLDENGIVGGD